jgi:hypothetical protein
VEGAHFFRSPDEKESLHKEGEELNRPTFSLLGGYLLRREGFQFCEAR